MFQAAEESMKGRKNRDTLLTSINTESPRTPVDTPAKVNGGPQSYLNQTENHSPSSAGPVHIGGQNVSIKV